VKLLFIVVSNLKSSLKTNKRERERIFFLRHRLIHKKIKIIIKIHYSLVTVLLWHILNYLKHPCQASIFMLPL